MKVKFADPKHEIAYQDLVALVRKHGDLEPIELLAIACNMVGKLIAYQDQRQYNSREIMEMVAQNIEVGNQQVLAELDNKTGGHA